MTIEKETLLSILELYKDMPFLWDKNNPDYKNKECRYDGFKVLLEIYKKFDPDATMKTLKKRLENMKAAYLREEKKVKSSKHTGAGSADVYVPTLWYFDAFSFLGSTSESCRPVKDSMGNENEDSSLSDTETESSQTGLSNTNPVPTKKKKTFLQKQENILNIAEKVLAMKEEDWECIGRSIGLQLRDLNKQSLTIVNKLIADAIYYAKIGRLTEDSYIHLGSTSHYQACRSSLSLYSPSPPLYSNSDASSSRSSINPTPSHQINRIQLSCSSPQYQFQSPKQSPQYQIQSPKQSPQYQPLIPNKSQQHQSQLPNQSPRYQALIPNQSQQYQTQLPNQSPRYHQALIPNQSQQYQTQLPNQSPRYQALIPNQSQQYQIQLPNQSPRYPSQIQSLQCQVQMPDPSLSQNQIQLDHNQFQFNDQSSQYQLDDPSPQYQVQLDDPSPQHQVQLDDPSPQHQVQLDDPSPQHQVQLDDPSQQHQVQLDDPSPQHQVQLDDPSPQHQVQLHNSSGQYQIHVVEQSQESTNSTAAGNIKKENSNNVLVVEGTGADLKDFLIFKKTPPPNQ